MEAANRRVQEWETLMWVYRQALPIAKEGEKWLLMDKIFQQTPQRLLRGDFSRLEIRSASHKF